MTITRVRWRERQRVSAADLRAEQLYRLEGLGRHFLAPHDWGVVRGLWLVPDAKHANPSWQLLPGVAIDGYGRALLVREPIDIELPAGAKRLEPYRVFLYYCESPSGCPPCAPCRDDQAPRAWQHVQVVVSDTLSPITGHAADLSLARAAGTVADQPTWPVLVGTITLGSPDPVNAEVRYHAQRASILRSPSGRVALRQGLLGPNDQYQLLLSTSPDKAAPVKRLGIDRDGIVHVWKRLVLTGPTSSAKIAFAKAAALFIDTPTLAGVDRRVVVRGTLDKVSNPLLVLHWSDNTGAREVVNATLRGREKAHLNRTLLFRDAPPVALRLVNLGTMHPIQVSRLRGGERERAFVVKEFVAEPSPSQGRLALATRTIPVEATSVAPCDEDSRVSGSAAASVEEGGIAYFRAAVQPTPAPTARAIQTVTEERPDGVPATAFRIAGGEFDEGDHTPRIAFGSRRPTVPSDFGWHATVTIDGGGRVRMPQDGTALAVSRTLQLPPITTSPTDPLTQDLLALAFQAGLRRAGRLASTTQFKVEVTTPPNTSVKRGDTLTYHLKITGIATQSATLKRVLEGVVGGADSKGQVLNADVALRTIPHINGTADINQDITIPNFRHAAQQVVIAVDILVTIAGKDYVCSGASSATVAVTD